MLLPGAMLLALLSRVTVVGLLKEAAVNSRGILAQPVWRSGKRLPRALRSSRGFKNTVRGSGAAGKSGNASHAIWQLPWDCLAEKTY